MSTRTVVPAVAAEDRSTNPPWKRLLAGGSGAIWVASLALFLVSPVVAPGSLDYAAVVGMLPFASILAIAAAGQTLVVQQRGLDLSVPGMLAFGAVLASGLPQWYGWPAALAIAAAIVLPGVAGVVNGLAVTRARVMPLVATLGMNAFLLGLTFQLSSGTPAGAPQGLADFTKAKILGVPSTLLVAAVIFCLAALTVQRSIIGRKLTAVGVSERASAAAGFRVGLYQTAAYGGAGVLYGLAAVLYTGYVTTPPLFFGDSYLLASIAAVVLGGTALTGGRAAVVASGIGALFLTQLGQLLRSMGLPEPTQLIIQACVLLAVVLIRAGIPMIQHHLKRA
ncbi:ABC transporter permease [Micromonospora sp. WMMD558]|uniref:ABC transporter permease n=1 Tax=Micromonospora sp. WMMD558 TaxID=3403462 RepID=UPI003BF55042